MSLRQSGLWCDVCNSPMVSEMLTNEPVRAFKVSCSPSEMHAHRNCESLIAPAIEALDETLLPSGSPLGSLIARVRMHNAKRDERVRDQAYLDSAIAHNDD